jgi:hypothetical protein
MRPVSPPVPPGHTARQGQYLAFIHAYQPVEKAVDQPSWFGTMLMVTAAV